MKSQWIGLPNTCATFNLDRVSYITFETLADEKENELPTHDYTVVHFVDGRSLQVMEREDMDIIDSVLDRVYKSQATPKTELSAA